jgi:hypothetical protein
MKAISPGFLILMAKVGLEKPRKSCQWLSSSFRRKISQKLHDRAHPRRADQIAMHNDQQLDRQDLL